VLFSMASLSLDWEETLDGLVYIGRDEQMEGKRSGRRKRGMFGLKLS
jgi:hypothetical protein